MCICKLYDRSKINRCHKIKFIFEQPVKLRCIYKLYIEREREHTVHGRKNNNMSITQYVSITYETLCIKCGIEPEKKHYRYTDHSQYISNV